jgi:hypothetical protein
MAKAKNGKAVDVRKAAAGKWRGPSSATKSSPPSPVARHLQHAQNGVLVGNFFLVCVLLPGGNAFPLLSAPTRRPCL